MSSEGITHTIRPYYGETTDMHSWTLTIDGETVAELWISIETSEIMQVETPAAHQGEGYATRLYRAAAAEMTVLHAPESHRTYEGNRFAKSVGGDSVPCTYGCCE